MNEIKSELKTLTEGMGSLKGDKQNVAKEKDEEDQVGNVERKGAGLKSAGARDGLSFSDSEEHETQTFDGPEDSDAAEEFL